MEREENVVLPLTLGLLASAMMRRDHGVFLPPHLRFMPERPWRTGMVADMDVIMARWDAARKGLLADAQILEEFEGRGFYSREAEATYACAFDEFPDMREIAISRLQAFRGPLEQDG